MLIFAVLKFFPLLKYWLYFNELNTKYKITIISLTSIFIIAVLIVLVEIYFILDTNKQIDRKLYGTTRGLEAEQEVAKALRTLDDNYLIVHDLYVGKGNIDHLVIYLPKNLIFVIETKSVPKPKPKDLENWKRYILSAINKLNNIMKKFNLKEEKDYKIIPMLVLPNSYLNNPSGKVVITNKENLLKLIINFSKSYKSYKNENINWEKMFKNWKV
jgi:hypothetical protein